MGMSCCCEMRLVARAEASMCESVFPRFSKMLEDEKYKLAIGVMAKRQNINEWYNLVDFVFVRIYTEWRKPCKKFYAGKGPALVDHPDVTPEMIAVWDVELCKCLEFAAERAQERGVKGWWTFRYDFLKSIGKTPPDKYK
jgi:hypothetical protein